MKTLSDFKKLPVGTLVKTIFNSYRKDVDGVTRKIIKKQSNAFVFEDKEYKGGVSWLYFPGAKLVEIEDDIIKIYDEKKIKTSTGETIFDSKQKGELAFIYQILPPKN